MELLDLTLPKAAENVALDEALLEEAERGGTPHETLRFWEAPHPCVVVGRSSRLQEEVREEVCSRENVPVVRRCSGGAAIVAGPGCLMYAVVLSIELRPQLQAIDRAHQFVLETVAQALRRITEPIELLGTSDLSQQGRKFSGNSMRCKRTHLLYHGTLLYDFPLDWVERFLKMPPRQPDYRAGRGHSDFVTNLPATSETLRAAVRQAWEAAPGREYPRAMLEELMAERYADPAWHRKL